MRFQNHPAPIIATLFYSIATLRPPSPNLLFTGIQLPTSPSPPPQPLPPPREIVAAVGVRATDVGWSDHTTFIELSGHAAINAPAHTLFAVGLTWSRLLLH